MQTSCSVDGEKKKRNSFRVSLNLERTEVMNTAAMAGGRDFRKSPSKPDLKLNQRIISITNPKWKAKTQSMHYGL